MKRAVHCQLLYETPDEGCLTQNTSSPTHCVRTLCVGDDPCYITP